MEGFCKLSPQPGALAYSEYRASGSVEKMDEAIKRLHTAIETSPPDARHRGLFHHTLSIVLLDRYERRGTIEDLDNAIGHNQWALDLTRVSDSRRSVFLGSAGILHRFRYVLLKDRQDLRRAIEYLEEAVEKADNSESRAARLTNLGNALLNLAAVETSSESLEQAIDAHRRSVELTPKQHRSLPLRLNNLGNSLSRSDLPPEQWTPS